MIVTLSAGKIKRLARQMLKGRFFSATLMVLLAMIIAQGPVYLFSYLFRSDFVNYLLNFYTVIVTGPVILGLSYYFIEMFRGSEGYPMESYAKSFSNIWNAIGLFTLTMIITILWSLLFVIPGIIAAIKYSQAFFILADEPELRPVECLLKSRLMMYGNKSRFFWLQFSFLPWLILLTLPSSFYLMMILDFSADMTIENYTNTVVQASSDPIYIVLSMLVLLVQAYVLTANACFYDIASGNLRLQYDGQVSLGQEAGSRDIYEITGFESHNGDDNN